MPEWPIVSIKAGFEGQCAALPLKPARFAHLMIATGGISATGSKSPGMTTVGAIITGINDYFFTHVVTYSISISDWKNKRAGVDLSIRGVYAMLTWKRL